MKVICSTVNKTYGCDECPHGNPHEPMDSKFTYENGKKIPTGKCTTKGICYEGRQTEWECQCVEVKINTPVAQSNRATDF